MLNGRQNLKIKVVVHEAEEGGYWAEVPAIPGCATQGETFEELLTGEKTAPGAEPSFFALGLASPGNGARGGTAAGYTPQAVRDPRQPARHPVLKALGITQLDPPQPPLGEETLM